MDPDPHGSAHVNTSLIDLAVNSGLRIPSDPDFFAGFGKFSPDPTLAMLICTYKQRQNFKNMELLHIFR